MKIDEVVTNGSECINWKDEMRIEIAYHVDMWQEIKNDALFTIHKKNGSYPDTKWKEDILIAEHSPIRTGRIIVNVYNIPSFVCGHFVRHNMGFTPFVASFRKDRFETDEIPNRETPKDMRFDGNFQAFINISRKRYCNCASEETRYVWKRIMDEIRKIEPELYMVCLPECIYRCGCSEMFSCEELFFVNFLKWCNANNIEQRKLFNVHKRYKIFEKYRDELDKKITT